jgi:hypothetical protein
MTPQEYISALHAAGIPEGLPVLELDRQAASLLKVDERTARRYRRGEIKIPGPVEVALVCLALRMM